MVGERCYKGKDCFVFKKVVQSAKGTSQTNNVEVLPNGLAGIPAGLARMEADQVSGLKLVARPQETP